MDITTTEHHTNCDELCSCRTLQHMYTTVGRLYCCRTLQHMHSTAKHATTTDKHRFLVSFTFIFFVFTVWYKSSRPPHNKSVFCRNHNLRLKMMQIVGCSFMFC